MRVEMMVSGKGDMLGMTPSKGKSKKQEEEMISFADVLTRTDWGIVNQNLVGEKFTSNVQSVTANTLMGVRAAEEAVQVSGELSGSELLSAQRAVKEMWNQKERPFQMEGEADKSVSLKSRSVSETMKGSISAESLSLEENQQLHMEKPVLIAKQQGMAEEGTAPVIYGQHTEEDEDLEVKQEQDLYPQQEVQSAKLESGQKQVISIKVAEPYHMANQDFSEKVSDSISHQLEAGTKQYQIRLEPEQLGRIDVEISLGGEQAVVKLSCENQETARLLTRNAQTIGALIEYHGTEQIMVQVRQEGEQLWDQQQQGQNHGQGSDGQNGGNQNRDHREKKNRQQYEGSDFLDQLRLGLHRSW